MNIYHIRFTLEDDFYVLQAVEDEAVYSQARTLDEAVLMIRDVLDAIRGEKDAELRLIIPADLFVDDARQSGRITHAVEDEADAGDPSQPATRKVAS